MDTPKYQTAIVAKAARIEPKTLKTWMTRASGTDAMSMLSPDHLEPDKLSLGRAAARLFTRRGVYRFAVLGALNRFGMPPSQGIYHAMHVCDRDLTGRLENCRFPNGETFLVVTGDGNSAVLNVTSKTSTYEVLHPVIPGADTESMIMIDIGALLRRVDAVLDAKS